MQSTEINKRIHRSRAQWAEVVADFKQSGLSKVEFCRQQSLSPQMFALALTRQRLEVAPGFARLLSPKPPGSILVEMPGGIRL